MERMVRLAVAVGLLLMGAATVVAQLGQRPRPFPGPGPMGPPGPQRQAAPGTITPQSGPPYIDTHAHLDGRVPRGIPDYDGAVQVALRIMDALNIARTVVMPPPFPPKHPNRYDYEDFLSALRNHSERFAFLGGGGSLNGMIQEALTSGRTLPSLEQEFDARAERILRDGAVGFGELAAEHLSFNPRHPYESAPPDHPLFLRLAEIAARHGVPIDLHMEAVAHDMPLPTRFLTPPNAPTLRENLSGLERLLAHNREARIVWAHAGWDNTGHWTVELCRRLLEKHPNLYMSIKIDSLSLPDNRPLENRVIRPEWVELLRAFPDRFVIGSDQFYTSPRLPIRRVPSAEGPRAFLNQLPADLAQKVGIDNPRRLYNLAPGRGR